jgi:CheY-like chemotaxis protein
MAISIIDDDQFAREATGDLVQSLGYEVLTFESAERFLESGCLAETSCLITDLQMPGLSGLDLQSRLIEEGQRIPVIFVTAFPEEAVPKTRQECWSRGLSEQAFRRGGVDTFLGDRPSSAMTLWQWRSSEERGRLRTADLRSP